MVRKSISSDIPKFLRYSGVTSCSFFNKLMDEKPILEADEDAPIISWKFLFWRKCIMNQSIFNPNNQNILHITCCILR